jgi:hypothetical protein
MVMPRFADEYAYVRFTSYYYYGSKAYLGFTAKGRQHDS